MVFNSSTKVTFKKKSYISFEACISILIFLSWSVYYSFIFTLVTDMRLLLKNAFLVLTGGRSQEENVQRYHLLCASGLHRCRSSVKFHGIHQLVCPNCGPQTRAARCLGPAAPPLSAPRTDQPGADSRGQRLHRHLRTAGTHCGQPGTQRLDRYVKLCTATDFQECRQHGS